MLKSPLSPNGGERCYWSEEILMFAASFPPSSIMLMAIPMANIIGPREGGEGLRNCVFRLPVLLYKGENKG